jgi:hydrogenase maturation protease
MIAGLAETRLPVLVLGLGNLLLGDDGVGLRLLEDLRDESGEAGGVEFVDGGTQGLALLGYLAERPAVLILDAVGLGEAPGTVHVLDESSIAQMRTRAAATAHEGNALEVLAMARLLGQAPGRVRIVGVEPAVVRTGIGLSPAVESALPAALAEARRVLETMRRG